MGYEAIGTSAALRNGTMGSLYDSLMSRGEALAPAISRTGQPAEAPANDWFSQNPYQASPQPAAPQAQVETGGGQYPLSSVSGEGFMRPWTTAWDAPSQDEMRSDDAYQFALGEGRNQIERSAAARGTLLTGGTLKDLTAWSQGLASQQFDKIYNRRQGEYKDAYNIYKQNQNDQWNRLSSLAGTGQTAANTLGDYGGQFGQMAGNNMMGAANAGAAATARSGAQWGSTLGSLANFGSDIYASTRQPAQYGIGETSGSPQPYMFSPPVQDNMYAPPQPSYESPYF